MPGHLCFQGNRYPPGEARLLHQAGAPRGAHSGFLHLEKGCLCSCVRSFLQQEGHLLPLASASVRTSPVGNRPARGWLSWASPSGGTAISPAAQLSSLIKSKCQLPNGNPKHTTRHKMETTGNEIYTKLFRNNVQMPVSRGSGVSAQGLAVDSGQCVLHRVWSDHLLCHRVPSVTWSCQY